MIGLLILAQKDLGEGLIVSAEHVLGARPPALERVAVDYDEPLERLDDRLRQALVRLDQGEGVLILADLYGASHTNIACRRLARGRVELIAGVSLPLLLRVLNYRGLPLTELVAKILRGAGQGVVAAPGAPRAVNDRR
jgi:PTS system ascorbate-specific IIA component